MGFNFMPNSAIGTVMAVFIKMRKRRINAQSMDAGSPYTPPVYYLAGIPMHVLTQEAYELSSDVPQHAVESGVIFTDHIIQRPLRLNVSFEVSNYDGLGDKASAAKNALDEAIKVWQNRELMGIQTTHKYFDNMVCLSLTPENEMPEWGRLRFRATFQQVQLVTLETLPFPAARVQGDMGGFSKAPADNPVGGPYTPKSGMSPTKLGPTKLKGAFDKSVLFGGFK